MRLVFAGRLSAAVALLIAQCSLGAADTSVKTVTVSSSGQSTSSFKFVAGPSFGDAVVNAAEKSPQRSDHAASMIEIKPGYSKVVELDWHVVGIYIGDDKLVDVKPLDGKRLLIIGKHAEDASAGAYDGGSTSVYVEGENNHSINYTVNVNPVLGSWQIETHSSDKLINYVSFDCSGENRICENPVFHEIRKEDLPRGYINNTNTSTFKGAAPESVQVPVK